MTYTRIEKGILRAMHQINRPATINEIAQWSEYSWITVRKHLRELKKAGIVSYKKEGNRKYWRIKYELLK